MGVFGRLDYWTHGRLKNNSRVPNQCQPCWSVSRDPAAATLAQVLYIEAKVTIGHNAAPVMERGPKLRPGAEITASCEKKAACFSFCWWRQKNILHLKRCRRQHIFFQAGLGAKPRMVSRDFCIGSGATDMTRYLFSCYLRMHTFLWNRIDPFFFVSSLPHMALSRFASSGLIRLQTLADVCLMCLFISHVFCQCQKSSCFFPYDQPNNALNTARSYQHKLVIALA